MGSEKDLRSVTEARLAAVVLSSHVLLAGGGLLVWVVYLVLDQDRFAWTAVVALCLAATLGIVMAIRWLAVYQASRSTQAAPPAGPRPPRPHLNPATHPAPPLHATPPLPH